MVCLIVCLFVFLSVEQEISRYLRPNTLRALYGKDKVKNAVHCTDLPEDAVLEVGAATRSHTHTHTHNLPSECHFTWCAPTSCRLCASSDPGSVSAPCINNQLTPPSPLTLWSPVFSRVSWLRSVGRGNLSAQNKHGRGIWNKTIVWQGVGPTHRASLFRKTPDLRLGQMPPC